MEVSTILDNITFQEINIGCSQKFLEVSAIPYNPSHESYPIGWEEIKESIYFCRAVSEGRRQSWGYDGLKLLSGSVSLDRYMVTITSRLVHTLSWLFVALLPVFFSLFFSHVITIISDCLDVSVTDSQADLFVRAKKGFEDETRDLEFKYKHGYVHKITVFFFMPFGKKSIG